MREWDGDGGKKYFGCVFLCKSSVHQQKQNNFNFHTLYSCKISIQNNLSNYICLKINTDTKTFLAFCLRAIPFKHIGGTGFLSNPHPLLNFSQTLLHAFLFLYWSKRGCMGQSSALETHPSRF